jgi:hypothetical protein
MVATPARAGERSAQDLARELGFRRVDFIRLIVSDDEVRAEAVGVAHRLPVSRPIPIHVASACMRAGTRHVMVRVQVPSAG